MKFACLVYIEDKKRPVPTADEMGAIVADCDAAAAWHAELKKSGHLLYAAGLQSVRTAVTMRNLGDRPTRTDGPFAETKEFLGGLSVIDAQDMTEAVQLVSKLQTRMLNIEIRPVMEPGAELADAGDRAIVEAIYRRHASQSDEHRSQ
jgi:hypothetical protein